MFELLKYAVDDDETEKWTYQVYEPNKLAENFNLITFFIADDSIDFTDLQQYREQTKTECLIAIKTTDKDYECMNIADSMIECKPNDVENAVYGLAFMINFGGFIGIDWYDVKTAIFYGNNIQFLHSSAIGENCVAVACKQLIHKFKTHNFKYLLKGMMISIFADVSFDFEKLEFITIEMQKNIDGDDANVLYQVNFFDEFDVWKDGEKGCCICMFLTYSDKENDIEPVIIEHNIPIKITNPKQVAGNTIQEYLRRQHQRSNNG